jgi:hypothetical protein
MGACAPILKLFFKLLMGAENPACLRLRPDFKYN